jgi:tRNA threonylcarbamoyladenosine biosynthesis protein TsaB
MLALTIETSTPRESVAVVRDGVVLAERTDTVGRGHTEMLLGAVDKVLVRAGIGLRDLDALVVSTGPGRFSGLRVGLATAKGISAVSGLPLLAVGTLEALAASGPATEGLVAPLLDARRGEVYSALFRIGEGTERLLPDTAASPSVTLRALLHAAGGDHVHLTGSGAPLCASELQSMGLGDGAVTVLATQAPTAAGLLAAAAGSKPVSGDELDTLEPIYLRGV